MTKYYFELSDILPDIFDEGDADYMLYLSNTENGWKEKGFDDNIGMHSSGVGSVIKQLGIDGSEMENVFMGKFNDTFPDLKSIQNHLESNGWSEYHGPTFVQTSAPENFEFECDEEDGFNYDFDEEEEEEDEYADDYSDEYDEE